MTSAAVALLRTALSPSAMLLRRKPRRSRGRPPIRAILPIAPGTGADVIFRLVFNL